MDQELAAVRAKYQKVIIINIITNHLHRIDLIATTAKKDAVHIMVEYGIATLFSMYVMIKLLVIVVVLMTENSLPVTKKYGPNPKGE